MDFKSLTDKLVTFGEKAAEVGSQALDQAGKFTGEMLEMTSDLSYDKIKTLSICIAQADAFDKVVTERNLVVFVVGAKDEPQSKAIIGRIPLLIAKAWQFSATLRVIYAADLPDLVQAIGAKTPSVCIYREGNQKFQLTGKKLDVFLDSFDIFADWSMDLPVEPTSTEKARSDSASSASSSASEPTVQQ